MSKSLPIWLEHAAASIIHGLSEEEASQFLADLQHAASNCQHFNPARKEFLLGINRRSLDRLSTNEASYAKQVSEAIQGVIDLLESEYHDQARMAAAFNRSVYAACVARLKFSELWADFPDSWSEVFAAFACAAQWAAEAAAASCGMTERFAQPAGKSAELSASSYGGDDHGLAETRAQRDQLLAVIREAGK